MEEDPDLCMAVQRCKISSIIEKKKLDADVLDDPELESFKDLQDTPSFFAEVLECPAPDDLDVCVTCALWIEHFSGYWVE